MEENSDPTSLSKDPITCRIGGQVKTETSGGTVYGYKYKFPINSGKIDSKTTLKIVACSYQSTIPDAQLSTMMMPGGEEARMVMSPVLSVTYGSRIIENACKKTDDTKCQDRRCLTTGLSGVLQDISPHITSNDCASFETMRENDNPNYPFCQRDSDCPSNDCRLTTWTKYLPYNESIVNTTMIDEKNTQHGTLGSLSCAYDHITDGIIVQYNKTIQNATTNTSGVVIVTRSGCFGGAVCKDSNGNNVKDNSTSSTALAKPLPGSEVRNEL